VWGWGMGPEVAPRLGMGNECNACPKRGMGNGSTASLRLGMGYGIGKGAPCAVCIECRMVPWYMLVDKDGGWFWITYLCTNMYDVRIVGIVNGSTAFLYVGMGNGSTASPYVGMGNGWMG